MQKTALSARREKIPAGFEVEHLRRKLPGEKDDLVVSYARLLANRPDANQPLARALETEVQICRKSTARFQSRCQQTEALSRRP